MAANNSTGGVATSEGGGSNTGGAESGLGGATLKKGPWTAAEDAILVEYVRKHGEGNWNAVQRNSGLARCGKSCRLRWANHLRPNLKKGAFTPEEERLILELHAKYGNKWARMAAQLPGRTDNEIKNYWNTRVKRRQRQGLPLYPHDIQPSSQTQSPNQTQTQTQLQLQHQYQSQSTPTTPTTPTAPTTPTTPTTPTFHFQSHAHHHPSFSLSPTPPPPPPSHHQHQHQQHQHHSFSLSPSKPQHFTTNTSTSLPLFDPTNNSNTNTTPSSFTFHRPPPILGAPIRFKRYRETTGFSLPLSPAPHTTTTTTTTTTNNNNMITSPTSITPLGQLSSTQLPDISCFKFPLTYSHSAPQLISTQLELDQMMSAYSMKQELPSSQLSPQHHHPPPPHPPPPATTMSEITIDTKVSAAAANRGCGNGLLEDLLDEAHALAISNQGLRTQSFLGVKEEKRVFDGFKHWEGSSTIDCSPGVKPKEEPGVQINTMQEDLSKLLNVIPSTMQIPSDWYSDSGEVSNGQSSGVTDENIGIDMQHIASLFPLGATTDHSHSRTTGSCSWDNLPGIC
ncbi:transcription factor MYB120-like [Quercus lobata]|uniref:Uncharacterized protein n=1 Tax=Quercus lobata TaxID=97700 RepID=A0A7N2M191_QUELO|nr:transcription factor MYB120-like [Quercus lobata]